MRNIGFFPHKNIANNLCVMILTQRHIDQFEVTVRKSAKFVFSIQKKWKFFTPILPLTWRCVMILTKFKIVCNDFESKSCRQVQCDCKEKCKNWFKYWEKNDFFLQTNTAFDLSLCHDFDQGQMGVFNSTGQKIVKFVSGNYIVMDNHTKFLLHANIVCCLRVSREFVPRSFRLV